MIKRHNIIKYGLLVIVVVTVSGCSSFGYYLDLMAGHSELLDQRKSVADILAQSETDPKLRKLLKTSQDMRNFASNELHLPENDSYRSYADLKRPYAVWNVIAADEFSVKPKKWCFLIVGCLSYRGYFSKEEATEYANELKAEGYDVYVAGAKAYSTLGWFDDPLLNTMMYKSEARRAGIIFHELAHQVLYIENDTAFNEAFATAVEQEGIRRWLIKKGQSNKYNQYLINKKRDSELNDLLRKTRDRLKDLYKTKTSDENKRRVKKQIFALMQTKYQKLKKSWAGYSAYDQWMKQDLNNSHLLLIATYYDLVPFFNNLLKKGNNNIQSFYSNVKILGKLDDKLRKIKISQINQLAKK